MVFTSLKFAAFFAAIFILYFCLPAKYQRFVLLIGSYVFYAFTSVKALFMLFAITLITYAGGRVIGANHANEAAYLAANTLEREDKKAYKASQAKLRGYFLTAVIVALLGILFVFKYLNFTLFNISLLLGTSSSFKNLEILLPIGLSFYMFQTMGYVIDVYRGGVEAEKDITKYALFASYFPQIMQGPIGDYSRLAPQLYSEHQFDVSQAVLGLQRVAWGVFKKLVIANNISLAIDRVFNTYWTWEGFVWVIVLCMYAIHLYADFSGYMDIAIGCSQMLGIEIDENFNAPYFSKSVPEFWRRWHMTLGAWFKNYLFYPLLRTKWLDGMRKKLKKSGKKQLSSTLPTVIALGITWVLTGIWHGASWNYLAYGAYYAFFLMMAASMEPVYTKWQQKHPKISDSKWFNSFRVVRTFTIVTFEYAIFRPYSLTATGHIISSMFTCINKSDVGRFLFANYYYIFAAVLGTIVLTVVDVYHLKHTEKCSFRSYILALPAYKKHALYILVILAIIFLGAYGDASLNSFAYFQF